MKTHSVKEPFLAALLMALGTVSVAEATPASSYSYGSASYPGWNGLYAGVHLGGTWGDFNNLVPAVSGPTGTGGNVSGGGTVGYNMPVSDFIIGAEADFDWIDVDANNTTTRFEENWQSTIRARGGLPIGSVMPYITVGFALTDVTTSVTGSSSVDDTRLGVAGGAGVDAFVHDNWFARLEYLYTSVPRDTVVVGATPVAGGSDNGTVRVGIHYKFQ